MIARGGDSDSERSVRLPGRFVTCGPGRLAGARPISLMLDLQGRRATGEVDAAIPGDSAADWASAKLTHHREGSLSMRDDDSR